MPESKGRPKPAFTPPRRTRSTEPQSNAPWFVPVMLGLMVVGLVWVVTFYISGINQYPVPQIGRWNLGVGFGLMLAGFLMTTRWR
ncbi:cell division protein CrgA [Phycicoccus sp. BSK3Z-2]|uniref:Cell division protein CrgA n=1 Tax=Phycicoccus avicenniae TaxID=2828860 RepID=A0A941D6W2_9MICO|nr:cell division protein CrgA [Phycicoccus avicenniae]MBR7742556.1 cell division protein CrgA [Phycicoccus avicenniae]